MTPAGKGYMPMRRPTPWIAGTHESLMMSGRLVACSVHPVVGRNKFVFPVSKGITSQADLPENLK